MLPYMLTVRKFNNILEELVLKKKHHYIMDVSQHLGPAPANFTPSGHLNDQGKDNLWFAIDRIIEDFDFGETDLKPKIKSSGQSRNNISASKPHLQVRPQQRN